MNGEWPDLEAIAGPNLAQLGIVQEPMLIQLVFYIGQGELRSPDRNVQFRKNPRQGADMVFMSMREHNGAYALAILHQVGNVGDNDVHTQQFGFGEHHAGVNDDDVVAPAHGHTIHAELAEAAKGY